MVPVKCCLDTDARLFSYLPDGQKIFGNQFLILFKLLLFPNSLLACARMGCKGFVTAFTLITLSSFARAVLNN